MQIELHKPNSWVLYKIGLESIALVLKAGITIASPDPKADAKLHVSPSGVHHGGTIKVIVVSWLINSLHSRGFE